LAKAKCCHDDIWKKRIEDILYFETDPCLSQEQIMAFGKKLRSEFYKSLPEFIDAIRLKDQKDLYAFHADFLSRLAMTFSHGDYSGIEEIEAPDEIALSLYKRACYTIRIIGLFWEQVLFIKKKDLIRNHPNLWRWD
jgi:hypothetical protein